MMKRNEPVFTYDPSTPTGQKERKDLKTRLESMAAEAIDIPSVIGGQAVAGSKAINVVMPHDHHHVVGKSAWVEKKTIHQAIDAALKAKPAWEALPWQERAAVFLKAADLLAGPWRTTLNAATMLGQSKTVFQAELDSACELIDFFRFNANFYEEILQEQPLSSPGISNQSRWRPLEGFVAAITPFNFTAIAGNLPATPAMVGNTVVWKPSDTQLLSAHYTMALLKEAGLPDGVINLVAADGPVAGDALLSHPELSGVHFTGSTATFQRIFQTVGQNLPSYRSYPRLVGETGGKGFVFAHPSADAASLTANLIRGAFEYQGQKCSAASRAYVPASLWKQIKPRLLDEIRTIKMGDVRDFSNFMSAVIDERSFNKIKGYIDFAASASDAKILCGGKTDPSKGYFVEPTVIETTNPKFKTMVEEIFGPVLTVWVYDDAKLDEAIELCDTSTGYSLTGAIFAQDRLVLTELAYRLRNAAGNLYFNDKPTGAVVGQQPFGGARKSGTNDKAGSKLNLYRWMSALTVKENFVPLRDYRYAYLSEK